MRIYIFKFTLQSTNIQYKIQSMRVIKAVSMPDP